VAQDFAGWRVAVMGGSRGIGRAVVLGFAARGADVATCARHLDALDAVRRDVAALGRAAYVAACDVAVADAVAGFVPAAAAALGGIDVLVNCASAFAGSDDAAGWSASIDVDLLGSIRSGQAALPFLKASRHGSIVNMSSIAAITATPTRIPYGAIKAAIVHATASNARLLAADRIRVNCVIPGSTYFAGGIWDRIERSNLALYEKTRDAIPLGRLAVPEDIANVVLFLASPAAGWITGQSIVVDGGQSLTGL